MNEENYEYNILEITEITFDTVSYFTSNPEIARKQYNELIERSRKEHPSLEKSELECYSEIHHIVPRCLGGKDEDSNLVLLPYKIHILAHFLLYAMNPENRDLFLSFSLMIQVKRGEDIIGVNLDYLSSLKDKRSEFMKGDMNPMRNPEIRKKVSETKKGMVSTFKGKHPSEETKKLLSEKIKALGISGENHPMYNKKHRPESIEKMKLAHKGQTPPPMSEKGRKRLSELRKKKVMGPDGSIYDSVRNAAKAIGVGRDVMSRYLNHRPEKGFKFVD